MNSNELKRYLTLNQEVQQIVADRSGATDMEHEELEPEEIAHIEKVIANGRNPKKWKRMSKFTVGGPSDEIFGSYYPDWKGCIAREFYLEDTDHITIYLITRDDSVIAIEDYSD